MTGCSSSNTVVNKGVIENHSKQEVTDVSVLHLPTHVVVGLSGILPGSEAQIGISARELVAEQAVLRWIENGIRHQVTFELAEFQHIQDESSHILVFRIYENGKATLGIQ